MMRSLFLFLAIFLTFTGVSQDEQLEEKTQRFLISPEAYVFTPVNLIYTPGTWDMDSISLVIPNPYPWSPDPNPYPWDTYPYPLEFTVSIFNPVNLCGERFYDNGNLQSRCACDADSVLHGKSVFWEKGGRISSVEYYSKGKVYTRKYYEEGRVTELYNYTYRNGEQLIHGEYIEYAYDEKTIGKYSFGKKVGPHTTYTSGIKTIVNTYENDRRIREERFDSEGKIYALNHYDGSGNLTGESFNFSQNREIKTITSYENGSKQSAKKFHLGVLVEHEEYNPDLVLRVNYYDNGDSLRLFRINSDGAKIFKEWDENQVLITDYVIENHKLVGSGFHTYDNTLTRFEQKINSNGTSYLECWVIVSGDTTEFYYARNEGGGFNGVMAKNHFTQLNGRAVKTGIWTTYENNQLISEISYSQGTKHGKAIYYDTARSEPIPFLIGNFHKGVRNNKWTLRNDTLLIETNYFAGNLHGAHSVSSRMADTTIVATTSELPQDNRLIQEELTPIVLCSFKKGLLEDKFRTFWKSGELHIEGYYTNGVFSYYFRATNPDGNLYRQGHFDKGEPSGKWYLLSKKKNGKIKRKRERKPLVAPEITIPLIEDIVPDFRELTEGSQLGS